MDTHVRTPSRTSPTRRRHARGLLRVYNVYMCEIMYQLLRIYCVHTMLFISSSRASAAADVLIITTM